MADNIPGPDDLDKLYTNENYNPVPVSGGMGDPHIAPAATVTKFLFCAKLKYLIDPCLFWPLNIADDAHKGCLSKNESAFDTGITYLPGINNNYCYSRIKFGEDLVCWPSLEANPYCSGIYTDPDAPPYNGPTDVKGLHPIDGAPQAPFGSVETDPGGGTTLRTGISEDVSFENNGDSPCESRSGYTTGAGGEFQVSIQACGGQIVQVISGPPINQGQPSQGQPGTWDNSGDVPTLQGNVNVDVFVPPSTPTIRGGIGSVFFPAPRSPIWEPVPPPPRTPTLVGPPIVYIYYPPPPISGGIGQTPNPSPPPPPITPDQPPVIPPAIPPVLDPFPPPPQIVILPPKPPKKKPQPPSSSSDGGGGGSGNSGSDVLQLVIVQDDSSQSYVRINNSSSQ
jgi:hypothetical protein